MGTSSAQVLDGFPKGWHKLAADAPQAAEAVAAADPLLAPPAGSGRTGPFATSSDYLPIGAFDIGGQHYLPGWSHPPDIIAFKHKPHYFLLEVQRVLAQPTVPGQAPPKAKADPSKPVVSVLMIRDLGNLRQKPGFVAGYSFVLFAVCVYVLHRRDKQAMAARGSALEPVGRR